MAHAGRILGHLRQHARALTVDLDHQNAALVGRLRRCLLLVERRYVLRILAGQAFQDVLGDVDPRIRITSGILWS